MAAVLQRDPGAGHADPAAKGQVVGLDHRDHHAVAIGCAEVDGATLRRSAGAGVGGALRDQSAAPGCVRLIQHACHGDLGALGVGDEAVGVGEGELHRFGLVVVAFGRFTRPAAEVKAFEDVERHQGCDALAVRGHLPHLVATIADADRVDPGVGVSRQVCLRDVAAGLGGEARYAFGDLARVEIGATRGGQPRERPRVAGRTKQFSRTRPASVRGERFEPASKLRADVLAAVPAFAQLPAVGSYRADGVAFARIGDGRLEQAGERQAPESRVQVSPGGGRPGHGHRQPAVLRYLAQALASEEFGRMGGGRPARSVQPVEFRPVPDEGKRIGTDAVGHRLHDGQRDRCSDRRVDRVATLAKHPQSCLGGKRFARRDDAPRGHDRHALRSVGELLQGKSRIRTVSHEFRAIHFPPQIEIGCSLPVREALARHRLRRCDTLGI